MEKIKADTEALTKPFMNFPQSCTNKLKLLKVLMVLKQPRAQKKLMTMLLTPKWLTKTKNNRLRMV